MNVTKEERDELRRLHTAWQEATTFCSARDDFVQEAADMALPLLDALAAAEAERDRLQRRLAKVEDIIAEFDDQPELCASIIGEHLYGATP